MKFPKYPSKILIFLETAKDLLYSDPVVKRAVDVSVVLISNPLEILSEVVPYVFRT